MLTPLQFTAWSPLQGAAAPLQAGVMQPGDAVKSPAGFQNWLWQSIEQTSELERRAQSSVAGLLSGDDLTQAEVFTAMKQADLAFRTMLQIRNKLLEAYNELKNIRM